MVGELITVVNVRGIFVPAEVCSRDVGASRQEWVRLSQERGSIGRIDGNPGGCCTAGEQDVYALSLSCCGRDI